MMSQYIKVCLIFLCITVAHAYQVLNLKNPTTKYGFVYPNRAEPNSNVTYALEGVDVLIYLAKVPENYAECRITTQDAEITFTLVPNAGERSKVEFWTPDSNSSGCGARIKNVKVTDSGRWRLQAVNEEEDHLYQSFINLKVIENFDRPDANFVVREGKDDELTIAKYASYCSISDPALFENHNIFDHCQVDLENISKLYAGKWKANVGVMGKIDEIVLHPRVEVVGENFEVGQNKIGKKINLYCNLKNSINSTITFCRFIKSGQETGLRLSEGLSNGNYSYFGQQLKTGDCGVTIEAPKAEDYGIWKCSLGIYRYINATNVEFEVKEAIISVSAGTSRRRIKRDARNGATDEKILDEVLAGVENSLDLMYTTNFQIKYCIIKHPNGTQYAINGFFANGNWMTKSQLDVGECGMTIFSTTTNETGLWYMQIGHYDSHEMDEIIKIPVRVGNYAMVAVEKDYSPEYGSQLTIKCRKVAKKQNLLEYCRFTLPNKSIGFRIDDTVTEDNPIDGVYWYNGSSIADGDCQVTIKKVNLEHFGEWQCSGKIQGSKNLEDYDTINVKSKGKLTIASISGIAVGASLAVIIVGGGFVYYRKKKNQQPQRRQTFLSASSRSSQSDVNVFERNEPLVPTQETQPTIVEEIEMGSLSRTRTSLPSRPTSAPLASSETLSEETLETAEPTSICSN